MSFFWKWFINEFFLGLSFILIVISLVIDRAAIFVVKKTLKSVGRLLVQQGLTNDTNAVAVVLGHKAQNLQKLQ
jgi:hypothetical protein